MECHCGARVDVANGGARQLCRHEYLSAEPNGKYQSNRTQRPAICPQPLCGSSCTVPELVCHVFYCKCGLPKLSGPGTGSQPQIDTRPVLPGKLHLGSRH